MQPPLSVILHLKVEAIWLLKMLRDLLLVHIWRTVSLNFWTRYVLTVVLMEHTFCFSYTYTSLRTSLHHRSIENLVYLL